MIKNVLHTHISFIKTFIESFELQYYANSIEYYQLVVQNRYKKQNFSSSFIASEQHELWCFATCFQKGFADFLSVDVHTMLFIFQLASKQANKGGSNTYESRRRKKSKEIEIWKEAFSCVRKITSEKKNKEGPFMNIYTDCHYLSMRFYLKAFKRLK